MQVYKYPPRWSTAQRTLSSNHHQLQDQNSIKKTPKQRRFKVSVRFLLHSLSCVWLWLLLTQTSPSAQMLCCRCVLPLLALYVSLEEISAAVLPSSPRNKRVGLRFRSDQIPAGIKPCSVCFIIRSPSSGSQLAGAGALPPAARSLGPEGPVRGRRWGRGQGCGRPARSFRAPHCPTPEPEPEPVPVPTQSQWKEVMQIHHHVVKDDKDYLILIHYGCFVYFHTIIVK